MRDDSASVSYDRIAGRYEEARGGAERADRLVAAIEAWLGPGVICDVGAGTGIVTERVVAPDRTVLAVDVSIEMLRRARHRLPGRVAVADASRLPFPTDSLDFVTFVWVLHHVGDLDATLHEAHRALRPGGRVVAISGLSIPTADEMSAIHEGLNDQLRPDRVRQALAVTDTAVATGFSVVHEGTVRMTAAVSPNDMADSIDERLFSHLWDLTDDQWASVVQPAIDQLRSLPDPDRVRQRVFDHPLVVLER